jgi:hypothetical protein
MSEAKKVKISSAVSFLAKDAILAVHALQELFFLLAKLQNQFRYFQ